MKDNSIVATEILIIPKGSETPITLQGNLTALHDNPEKIHQLLDLLNLPKGTEVRLTTKGTSVIVR